MFHKLIPLLSGQHRVFAVDLRGFGDSATAKPEHDSATSAQDLSDLIVRLGLGPVHLTGQDISGPTTFRVAATHPELVRSYGAIETGLPGFGLETLADVTHGGAWHIGVLAAPEIPEMLLAGRERAFIAEYAFPSLSATSDAISKNDIDEFTRSCTRPDAFTGASGLYRSMLTEGNEIREPATHKLSMPVLAVGGGSGAFTSATFRQAATDVSAVCHSTVSGTTRPSRHPTASRTPSSPSARRSTPRNNITVPLQPGSLAGIVPAAAPNHPGRLRHRARP